MPKLNQIIAIEKGVKNQTFQDITEGYHALQRTSQLAGIARSYTPPRTRRESSFLQSLLASRFEPKR